MKETINNFKPNWKNCPICNLSIDIKIDHYLILEEKIGSKKVNKSYYHTNCFGDKILVQNKISKMIGTQMQAMNKIIERIS